MQLSYMRKPRGTTVYGMPQIEGYLLLYELACVVNTGVRNSLDLSERLRIKFWGDIMHRVHRLGHDLYENDLIVRIPAVADAMEYEWPEFVVVEVSPDGVNIPIHQAEVQAAYAEARREVCRSNGFDPIEAFGDVFNQRIDRYHPIYKSTYSKQRAAEKMPAMMPKASPPIAIAAPAPTTDAAMIAAVVAQVLGQMLPGAIEQALRAKPQYVNGADDEEEEAHFRGKRS